MILDNLKHSVYSRNISPKINDGAYATYLDGYK